MSVVLFVALGATHMLHQHQCQLSNSTNEHLTATLDSTTPDTATLGHNKDGLASLSSFVLDALRNLPDRTVVIYTVLSLALWIFRNDFPFNLMILLICSFGVGRLTADLGASTTGSTF
jgi:hypothetical protein